MKSILKTVILMAYAAFYMLSLLERIWTGCYLCNYVTIFKNAMAALDVCKLACTGYIPIGLWKTVILNLSTY